MSTTDEETYILPNGNQITVDELVNLYKDVQRIPFPTSANIGTVDKQSRSVQVKWSFNNYERVEDVKFVTNCLVNYNESSEHIKNIQELPDITELNNELTSVTSDSGQYRICISKSTEKENKTATNSPKQRIDIWDCNQKTILNSIDVESTKHGSICLNARLSNLSFSPDEKQLLYVAEKKVKTESYFKNANLFKDDSKDDSDKSKETTAKGSEYELKDEWGEQVVGISHTCICILTIKPEYKLKIIELPNLTLAQPFWIDSKTIGFIAYQENPKRLGLVHCLNRVSYLYKCKLADSTEAKDGFEVIRGSNNDLSLLNSQINLQKDKVVFFENSAGGAHIQAQKLMLWNLKTNEIKTIFDLNEENRPVQSLFTINVSPNFWLSDGEHIVLTTIHHSKEVLFVLNVIDSSMSLIDFGLNGVQILNLKNNLLVIACSAPNQPPVIKIAQIVPNNLQNIEFKQLRSECKNDITYRIIKQNEDKQLEQIETILVGQTDTFNKPTPVIIIAHGGPHYSAISSFNRTIYYLISLGFKCAQINYRGGLGISKNYVDQLCGKVGDLDVKDCMTSINNLINLNLIDKNQVNLFGGSHGGFLVCHLVGQYPDFGFASCTALNPVTDISKMFAITDIPDWTLIEALGVDVDTFKKINSWPEQNNLVEQLNRIINVGKPEIMKTMFDKSPMKYIEKVKTPVLMILGQNDRRVPYYQGLSFVNALKVRGVETKCHLYQDNHNIGIPGNDGDFLINCSRWILRHLKR